MNPTFIIEMLRLQDRINSVIRHDWINANHPWSRAIMVESVELLDHIGWKWWKKQEPNMDQARMELVDIWHFILSDALVEAKGNVQAATLAIMEGWEAPHQKIFIRDGEGVNTPVADVDLHRRIELFGGLAGVNQSVFLPLFRMICEDCGLTFTRLFELYVCKNVLNRFRQLHGYANGTYVKVWNGLEDNEVLQQIIERPSVILTFESLSNELEQEYAKVTK